MFRDYGTQLTIHIEQSIISLLCIFLTFRQVLMGKVGPVQVQNFVSWVYWSYCFIPNHHGKNRRDHPNHSLITRVCQALSLPEAEQDLWVGAEANQLHKWTNAKMHKWRIYTKASGDHDGDDGDGMIWIIIANDFAVMVLIKRICG